MSKKRKLQRYIERVSKDTKERRSDCYDRSNVRLAIPFNMRCMACSEYIPMGRKYYATKATSSNENYLGVEVYVFEFKCPECREAICFKTDPKEGAYVEDRNCVRVRREKEERVKVVCNERYETESDRKRNMELASIKKFVEHSQSVDLGRIKERLEEKRKRP